MPLHGHVYTAPDALPGFDTDVALTADTAAAFHAHGYRYCVRYVRRDKTKGTHITPDEAATILESGLGLMLVQHVESEKSWAPSGDKGGAYGKTAAKEANDVGVPSGVILWCDLEGVARGTPAQDVIDYCNRWHEEVAGAGFLPGLYVGYHAGLNATQLYRSLRYTHYWAAFNLNADEAPAVRGVQMKQRERKPADAPPGITFEFQTDRVRTDSLGGRPTVLAPDEWLEIL